MKTVKLIDRGTFKAKDVLAQVLGLGGAQGITVTQMRDRVKLLDAIEAADGTLTLEDAPFGLLKSIVEAFPFGVSGADLLAVLDAAITPVETPAKEGA